MSMEVIWNALNYISEEMGIALRNTAYSPNIRDRLDHTCAIMSSRGELVAQAEHIPVHIGSMAVGVKNTIDYLDRVGIELDEGDVVLVNDPYIAGTHLNDIMLIKPIYWKNKLIAYLANKAHHVDVGGKVPGSIGGDVETLYDEGIVIEPRKLIVRGEIDREFMGELAKKVRTPNYLKGDLYAQIAALNTGDRRIRELIEKYGVNRLLEAVDESLTYTERYLKNKIRRLGNYGIYYATDTLEGYNGETLWIRVKASIREDSIALDYQGTSSQVRYPLNAVYGVTVAASTYAVKSVLDPDLPINHGIYRVLKINAERGSLLNPKPPAPVSGGNLETSQRIVDVVHKAFSEAYPTLVPAASCGSMNNVMIGGSDWAFYETVGGGSGARPNGDGVDGVHTNMTNTLNTPIEVLEQEFPIIFLEYSLREDSCGPGMYRGGLGIRRMFKVLDESVYTIMADRTLKGAYGLMGGGEGSPGRHYIIRSDGAIERLSGKDTVKLESGDVVVIETPGGGGYGDPDKRSLEAIINDLIDNKVSMSYVRKYYPLQYRELMKNGMIKQK